MDVCIDAYESSSANTFSTCIEGPWPDATPSCESPAARRGTAPAGQENTPPHRASADDDSSWRGPFSEDHLILCYRRGEPNDCRIPTYKTRCLAALGIISKEQADSLAADLDAEREQDALHEQRRAQAETWYTFCEDAKFFDEQEHQRDRAWRRAVEDGSYTYTDREVYARGGTATQRGALAHSHRSREIVLSESQLAYCDGGGVAHLHMPAQHEPHASSSQQSAGAAAHPGSSSTQLHAMAHPASASHPMYSQSQLGSTLPRHAHG